MIYSTIEIKIEWDYSISYKIMEWVGDNLIKKWCITDISKIKMQILIIFLFLYDYIKKTKSITNIERGHK